MKSENERVESLKRHIRAELSTIPLEQWGYLFPFLVALWRYIEFEHPLSLGEIRCGYDEEPYFKGPRAASFMTFVNEPRVFNALETLGYEAAAAIPQKARVRGFLNEDELPVLSSSQFVILVNEVESYAAVAC